MTINSNPNANQDYLAYAFDLNGQQLFSEFKIMNVAKYDPNKNFSSLAFAKIVRGKLNTEFRRSPYLIDYTDKRGERQANQALNDWMKNIYVMFVKGGAGAGKRTATWYFARQLYVCLATAIGNNKEWAQRQWDKFDDLVRTNRYSISITPESAMHFAKYQLGCWQRNLESKHYDVA